MNRLGPFSSLALLLSSVLYSDLGAESPVEAVSVRDPRVAAPVSARGFSDGAVLSADGRLVAFVSSADNLVANDHNSSTLDVFIRERDTGVTRLVSVSLDAQSSGNAASLNPSLSSDGRWVAFQSKAKNLVATPVSGAGDVFVRDLQTGTTALASVNQSGSAGGNGPSGTPLLTPDGRFVVFESAASDLAGKDTNKAVDVFVRDLKSGTTTLVSVNFEGTGSPAVPSGGGSGGASISQDGRFVAFASTGTNLVPGDANNDSDVFVRDVQLGTNLLVSVGANGLPPARGYAIEPLISADGRMVVYAATDYSRPPYRQVVFRRDLIAGTTRPVSPDQGASTGDAGDADMSADGRYVVCDYWNPARSLHEIWRWDAQTESVSLVSLNSAGVIADGSCELPSLSADGQTVAFVSDSTNLAPAFEAEVFQVYVRDLVAGATKLISSTANGMEASWTDCVYPDLSADGRVVTFTAADNNLVPLDDNNEADLFAREIQQPAVELISVGMPTQTVVTGNGASSLEKNGVSADGTFVLYSSLADDLIGSDGNQSYDLFLRDRVGGTNLLISVDPGTGVPAAGSSHDGVMSPDGRYVAFVSTARIRPDQDSNSAEDIYLRDVVAGTSQLVSVNLAGTAASGVENTAPWVSASGRYVAFLSRARDLNPKGLTTLDLHLRDLQTGTTVDISQKPTIEATLSNPIVPVAILADTAVFFRISTNVYRYDMARQANEKIGVSTIAPAFTPDGRYAALQYVFSRRLNSIARYDAQTGTTLAVLNFDTTNVISTSQWRLSMSADGRFIAFIDATGQLNPADLNHTNDVYVADLNYPGIVTLASWNAAGTAAGNGSSDNPALSADGRFVVFRSAASDLTPGDGNGLPDIFVRDLRMGITYLASLNPVTLSSGNNRSAEPVISANGSLVAFTSFATDLVEGDFNPLGDVFAFRVRQDGGGDSDHDGLPDAWELGHFGHLAQTAGADPDGDRFTNLDECLASTAPTDGNSCLRLQCEFLGSPARLRLSWPAVGGKTYRVQSKLSLAEVGWQAVPGAQFSVQMGALVLLEGLAEGVPQKYYRVVVEP